MTERLHVFSITMTSMDSPARKPRVAYIVAGHKWIAEGWATQQRWYGEAMTSEIINLGSVDLLVLTQEHVA